MARLLSLESTRNQVRVALLFRRNSSVLKQERGNALQSREEQKWHTRNRLATRSRLTSLRLTIHSRHLVVRRFEPEEAVTPEGETLTPEGETPTPEGETPTPEGETSTPEGGASFPVG